MADLALHDISNGLLPLMMTQLHLFTATVSKGNEQPEGPNTICISVLHDTKGIHDVRKKLSHSKVSLLIWLMGRHTT